MQILDFVPVRHSVRQFKPQPVHAAKAAQLQYVIDGCNREFFTHIQLILDDPQVFAGKKPFQNAVNYIALVGRRGSQEALGYCGEMLVLKAQAIGLNTCWVAGTYRKGKVQAQIGPGEKLYAVIALGYGQNPGKLHKEKKPEKRMQATPPVPEWFLNGLDSAMLAPTALHQQKFKWILVGENGVRLKSKGFCKRLNAGILKYHFELAAGKENFHWVK